MASGFPLRWWSRVTLPVLVWTESTITVLLLPSVTTFRLLPMAEAEPDAAGAGETVERAAAPALAKMLPAAALVTGR